MQVLEGIKGGLIDFANVATWLKMILEALF